MKKNKKRGSAMVFVFMLMLLFASLSIVLYEVSISSKNLTSTVAGTRAADQVADGGINYFLYQINKLDMQGGDIPTFLNGSVGQTSSFGPDGATFTLVSWTPQGDNFQIKVEATFPNTYLASHGSLASFVDMAYADAGKATYIAVIGQELSGGKPGAYTKEAEGGPFSVNNPSGTPMSYAAGTGADKIIPGTNVSPIPYSQASYNKLVNQAANNVNVVMNLVDNQWGTASSIPELNGKSNPPSWNLTDLNGGNGLTANAPLDITINSDTNITATSVTYGAPDMFTFQMFNLNGKDLDHTANNLTVTFHSGIYVINNGDFEFDGDSGGGANQNITMNTSQGPIYIVLNATSQETEFEFEPTGNSSLNVTGPYPVYFIMNAVGQEVEIELEASNPAQTTIGNLSNPNLLQIYGKASNGGELELEVEKATIAAKAIVPGEVELEKNTNWKGALAADTIEADGGGNAPTITTDPNSAFDIAPPGVYRIKMKVRQN